MNNNVIMCESDLSNEQKTQILANSKCIAIDTETTGLTAMRDQLSIIQINDGHKFYIVKFNSNAKPENFISLLRNQRIKKIFHHAPFDLSFIFYHCGINSIDNVVCTKIAYKLLHGIEKKSSLKDILEYYLDVKLDKSLQISDWSEPNLTTEQIDYAVNDVRYLIKLWSILEMELNKKNLKDLASKCFEYLPTQALLKNKGIDDIFKH